MKRLFDIIFSFVVITLFLPLGVLIVLILLFTGEGEIFYNQSRIGLNGKSFEVIKFATMLKDSPNIGAGDITLNEDSRVLRFGKLLRKTKLNEFPQFVNVLIGNMSIVGPRPLVKKQFDMIPENHKKIISLLKPGITGIGSLIFRDEEKFLKSNSSKSNSFYKDEIVPFKATLECWYYENSTLFNDILLVFSTAIMICIPKLKIYNHLFKNLPKHDMFT